MCHYPNLVSCTTLNFRRAAQPAFSSRCTSRAVKGNVGNLKATRKRGRECFSQGTKAELEQMKARVQVGGTAEESPSVHQCLHQCIPLRLLYNNGY